MRLAVAVFLCSLCYTTCSGQTDVPLEPGIAVNGKPLAVARNEDGHKMYQYRFHDQEVLSINVINNETYRLTDCYEDSDEPCWLPEGRKFVKEWPKRTFCCVARHSDSTRTTRLSVTTKLYDDNVAEIRMMLVNGKRVCEADKLVVGRAFRMTITPSWRSKTVYSVRCQDSARNGYNEIDNIKSRQFTQDPSGNYVTFPNSTLNVKGRWNLQCTHYNIPCVYKDYNGDILNNEGPGCWYRTGSSSREDQGVSCNVIVDVVAREDVVPPAGFIATNEKQFSSARVHAYYFTEGEQATFYCNRTVDGFAQLTYTDKAGNITSTQFHQQGSVALTLHLTAGASHGTVLECTIADVMYEDYLRIRVELVAELEDYEDS